MDVSATLIILFTIYGAILQASGAGKFFVDFSFALTGGRATSAGRTVVLSSFLLGGPSGSGVATTVTLGTVAWPMMRRVGYRPDDAGGLLAAGGLGAIISPPVLGAAAFLIAEYLKIGYLEVLRMAAVPTVLYYASLLFMVELDQRRIGAERARHGDRGGGDRARRRARPPLLVPLLLAARDRRLHGARLLADALRALRHGRRGAALLPAARKRPLAPQAARRAGLRRRAGGGHRRHLRLAPASSSASSP